jgi:hypothetical protein
VNPPRSEALTIEVPLAFKKRGGRKQIITPDGTCAPVAADHQRSGKNPALVRALARAYRWQHMLETGSYASITELAKAEEVNRSYLCRMLRLTLLAPEITCSIVNDVTVHLSLNELMRSGPCVWNEQRRVLT